MSSTHYAPNLNLLSLFCGAGGLDLGFRNAGFSVALAADFDQASVNTYNHNFKSSRSLLIDLSRIYGVELVDLYRDITNAELPIGILGGPPCQGFSQANSFSSPDDPRNKLPSRFVETLRAFNSAGRIHFFVFENVAGMKSQKHLGRYEEIRQEFEESGFKVFEQELNSRRYGVAQSRRRLFFVGLNRDIYEGKNFHFPCGEDTILTLRDTIYGLPDPTFYSRDLTPDQISYHPNHWTMRPKSSKFGKPHLKFTGRSFKRLEWDKLSPTVAYGHREIHVHPTGIRRLSIFEAMLLQGFPEEYELVGNLSEQVRQVSNAVPPPVAQCIASALLELIMPSLEQRNSKLQEVLDV